MGLIHKIFGKRAENAAQGLFNEMLRSAPRRGSVPPPEDETRFEDCAEEEAVDTVENGGLS